MTSVSLLEASEMAKRAYTEQTLVKGDAEVLLVETATHAYVAFRGSESIERGDWQANLDCYFHYVHTPENNKIGFHRGIFRYAETLFHDIDNFVRTSRLPIVIVGHSLGGGMAMCYAFHAVIETKMPIQQVITFGAPAVLDQAAQSYLAKRIDVTRVVNNNDIVPKIPPHMLHTGKVVYFNEAGEQVVYNYRNWVLGLIRATARNDYRDAIDDHAVAEYARNCSKARIEQAHTAYAPLPTWIYVFFLAMLYLASTQGIWEKISVILT